MRSKLDPHQIMQCEHDEASMAKRVKITDTEMSMELNADDGDSVQSQPREFSNTVILNEEFDISGYKNMKVYCKSMADGVKPDLKLEISPLASGDAWMDMGTILVPSPANGDLVASSTQSDLIAKRARITCSGSPSVEIYVLGRGA